MNRTLLMLALLVSTASVGCKPQAPTEPVAPAEPTKTEVVVERPAPVAADSAPSAAPEVPFDTKGFAGTFSGTLPCIDCPGVDTRLTFNADGTYKLHELYQGKPGNGSNGDGTWTVEENGKRIRLDPNSKSEQDRLYTVISKDEIEGLDLEGRPIASELSHTLKREGAAQ